MEHSQLQNSTQGFYIFADDSSALGTGKTGLTITATLSKVGGTANAIAPSYTEIGLGVYWVAPLASHRDTLGRMAFQFAATGAVIAPRFEKIVAVNDQVASFGANTIAPDNAAIALIRTAADDVIAETALVGSVVDGVGSALTVNVLPLTGVVESRIDGTTISVFTSETPTVSIAVVDGAGDSVTVTALTLSLVIERRATTDLIVIADGSITKSGSTISFVVPTEATSAEGHHRWSLRDTSDDSVLLQGPFIVTYSPTVDA
jgi:hypothetical protein